MSLVTEYKCPNCGAPLSFDAESKSIKCNNCGSSFSVKEVVDFNEPENDSSEFDWKDYKKNLNGEKLDDVKVYKCESCGAEIETDANTAATTCPYCNNNVILQDRLGGGLNQIA